jgi:hypothetical protein
MVFWCYQNLPQNIQMIPTRHTIYFKNKKAGRCSLARKFQCYKLEDKRMENYYSRILRFLNHTWAILLGHLRRKHFFMPLRSVWINEILRIFILNSLLFWFLLILLCPL